MLKVYLDVSALGRPFDLQSSDRITQESAAVVKILALVDDGKAELANSPALTYEISANPDPYVRAHLLGLLEEKGVPNGASPFLVGDMIDLLAISNVSLLDAMHASIALVGGSSFITCDDRLLGRLRRARVDGWCGTPVEFCSQMGVK